MVLNFCIKLPGKRKDAKAAVSVWADGTGDFKVNGQELLIYFPKVQDR